MRRLPHIAQNGVTSNLNLWVSALEILHDQVVRERNPILHQHGGPVVPLRISMPSARGSWCARRGDRMMAAAKFELVISMKTAKVLALSMLSPRRRPHFFWAGRGKLRVGCSPSTEAT